MSTEVTAPCTEPSPRSTPAVNPLEADLIALLRRADCGGAAGLVVLGEYLETVITR